MIIGCQKEEHFPVSEGDRLVRYLDKWDSGFREYNYSYDESGNMIEIEININNEFFGNVEYFFTDENQLVEALSKDNPNDSVIAKTEYLFNNEGMLHEVVYYISEDWGMTYKETPRGLKFHYDEQGNLYRREQLYKDSTVAPSSMAYAGINKLYKWENGNIIKEEYYNAEGVKALTKLYEYDNKLNFLKDLPPYITFPITQTRNNYIREKYIDHLGHFATLSCLDCTIKYKYNKSGKPVMYYNTAEKSQIYTMTYE